MNSDPRRNPAAQLANIVESAHRLGVELDEADALQWLTNIAAWRATDDVTFDERAGVFGHKVVMLDFSPEELAYFRQIGRLVEFKDQPGVVETALALSGSSAQSKIQTYPGDADYFERVNIIAPTEEEACRILAGLMRDKALSTAKGPTYQFIEAKFGSYPFELIVEGRTHKAGAPIAWTLSQIEAGQIEGFLPDGTPATVRWDDVALQPGWCKLDWIVADPVRGRLANASNMLDVTWEGPDGAIKPLDSYLDPYFQEVYLEAESVPIFSKLAQHVSADALDDYVTALEREVKKYLTKDVNYGKAAKRMYNIFRLTGRYAEAAFIRELFDEPASLLYQVWSLIRTLDDCMREGSYIKRDNLVAQVDRLILDVIAVLEGAEETEIVRQLLNLRSLIAQQDPGHALTAEAEAARQRVINVVNNFFHDRLVAIPQIQEYMAAL